MNEIATDEVLHIYNEILYTNTDFTESYEIVKGSFQQKILVLISEEDNLAANQELLGKMLMACKLTDADYQITILRKKNAILQVVNEFNPETLMLFGLTLNNDIFNIQKHLNKPFRFNNIKMLLSNTLTEINSNPALKSSLWTTGLKPLFNIQ